MNNILLDNLRKKIINPTFGIHDWIQLVLVFLNLEKLVPDIDNLLFLINYIIFLLASLQIRKLKIFISRSKCSWKSMDLMLFWSGGTNWPWSISCDNILMSSPRAKKQYINKKIIINIYKNIYQSIPWKIGSLQLFILRLFPNGYLMLSLNRGLK